MRTIFLLAVFAFIILSASAFGAEVNVAGVDIYERNGKNAFFLDNGQTMTLDINVMKFNPALTSATVQLVMKKIGAGGTGTDLTGALSASTVNLAANSSGIVTYTTNITSANGFERGLYVYTVRVTQCAPWNVAGICRDTETLRGDNASSMAIEVKTSKSVVPEIDPVLVVLAGLAVIGIVSRGAVTRQ